MCSLVFFCYRVYYRLKQLENMSFSGGKKKNLYLPTLFLGVCCANITSFYLCLNQMVTLFIYFCCWNFGSFTVDYFGSLSRSIYWIKMSMGVQVFNTPNHAKKRFNVIFTLIWRKWPSDLICRTMQKSIVFICEEDFWSVHFYLGPIS